MPTGYGLLPELDGGIRTVAARAIAESIRASTHTPLPEPGTLRIKGRARQRLRPAVQRLLALAASWLRTAPQSPRRIRQ